MSFSQYCKLLGYLYKKKTNKQKPTIKYILHNIHRLHPLLNYFLSVPVYQAGWSGRQMFRTAKIALAICSGSEL
jgi:steroid 5-alpha reductase family enzyme